MEITLQPDTAPGSFIPSPGRENVERVLVDTIDELWAAVDAGKLAILEAGYDCVMCEQLKDGSYFVAKRKHTGTTYRSAASAKAWIAKRVPTLK